MKTLQSFPAGSSFLQKPRPSNLDLPSFSTIHLHTSPDLPHALLNLDGSHTSPRTLNELYVRSHYRPRPYHFHPIHWLQPRRGWTLLRDSWRPVDNDPFHPRETICRIRASGVGRGDFGQGNFDNAEFCGPVLDEVEVSADTIDALPESVSPPQQIAACPGWLDAEFSQLGRGKGEEGLPGGDLGGVLGEIATDEFEECGGVRNEWCGLRDRWLRCGGSGMETAKVLLRLGSQEQGLQGGR